MAFGRGASFAVDVELSVFGVGFDFDGGSFFEVAFEAESSSESESESDKSAPVDLRFVPRC